jgi:hypothetical protein
MKVGDVIRIPSGARNAFKLKTDVAIVVGTVPREDDYPDDFEVLVDGLIYAMGFQLEDNAEVL